MPKATTGFLAKKRRGQIDVVGAQVGSKDRLGGKRERAQEWGDLERGLPKKG